MNYLLTFTQVAQCLLHAHCGWDILFEVLSLYGRNKCFTEPFKEEHMLPYMVMW